MLSREESPEVRAEKARLRLAYGRPERITDEVVVRGLLSLGARAEVGDGRRVAVFRYGSWDAARAFAEFNRRVYGLRVVGPFDAAGGPVCVLDLGPGVAS